MTLRADPPPQRFRVARARLAYIFERYALRDELITIAEGTTLLGMSREAIALLVLQGRLAVAEAVKERPDDRPPRLLVRAEVEAIRQRSEQGTLPFSAK